MTESELLGSEHLEAVSELQSYYPPEFRVVGQALVDKLEALQSTPPRLSTILFSQGQPTAYLVAYLNPSKIVSDAKEQVVFVDDLVTLPGRQNDLFRLLSELGDLIDENGLQALAIEAVCRRGAYELVTGHPRALERLGYECVADRCYWAPRLGEELIWLRLHPIQQADAASLSDRFAWSAELREEVEARLKGL